MNQIPDLLILGAGAVGLSLADVALREGLSVTLLDPSGVACEASWAGAGMLTCRPRTARDPNKPDYYDLAQWSVRLHAEWARRLKEETGIDTGYRACGALEVTRAGHTHQLEPELADGILADNSGGSANAVAKDDSAAWIERCVARGVAARAVTGDEARRLEPNLSRDVTAAIEFPNEAQVRNPWFARALENSIRKRGGTIITGVAGDELIFNERVPWSSTLLRADGIPNAQQQVAEYCSLVPACATKVIGVKSSDGKTYSAGAVAICTGAWTPLIAGLSELVPAVKKIQPVRGEILCYELRENLATRLICERSHYFVPRGDGVLLVGATHEKVGYNRSTTAAGRTELQTFAESMLPALKNFAPTKQWAGLRPGMKGPHPIVGQVPGIKNLFINAGHYRNGLTLAPACAEMLVDQILQRPERMKGDTWRP